MSTQLRTADNPDTAAFLDRRFAGQRGHLCIGSIDGDPSIKKGKPGYTPLKQEFYAWPTQRDTALERLAYLAEETAGNTYISVCLFTGKKRSYATAVPTTWLWIDDCDPDSFDFTEVIQTSDTSHQGWIGVDQALSAEARRDMVKRLRLHLGASDACSSDAIHMARAVGGYNSKRHGHFPVSVDTMGGKVWSVAELDALLPPLPIAATRTAEGETIALDDSFWRTVAHHYHNVDALLDSGRIAIIKPETQAGRILGDDLSQFQTNTGEDDRSMSAYVLAYGLHLRGFPDQEIAAIVLHKYNVWGTVREKGSAWAHKDIAERIIPKINADRPDISKSATHYRAMGTSTSLPYTPASHARKDRPQRIDAPALLDWYRREAGESGVVMMTRTEIAASLCISVPTLDRLDAILRGQGLIERRTERGGGANYSYVIICDVTHQEASYDDDSTPISAQVAKSDGGVLSPSLLDSVPTPNNAVVSECNRSNTTRTVLPSVIDPPTADAIADASTWLGTLRPWQIDKMTAFATADELLTWLEHRIPDDIEARAVIVALQRRALEPAPVAPAEPSVPDPVAATPIERVDSVTPKAQPTRLICSSVATSGIRRRSYAAPVLTQADYDDIAAVLEGREPVYSQSMAV